MQQPIDISSVNVVKDTLKEEVRNILTDKEEERNILTDNHHHDMMTFQNTSNKVISSSLALSQSSTRHDWMLNGGMCYLRNFYWSQSLHDVVMTLPMRPLYTCLLSNGTDRDVSHGEGEGIYNLV